MENETKETVSIYKRPWNKGKLIGQKSPLTPQQVWAIRVRLQFAEHKRDLALFNLALDSKLRGCDLVALKVSDVQTGDEIRPRAKIIQKPKSFKRRLVNLFSLKSQSKLETLWLNGSTCRT